MKAIRKVIFWCHLVAGTVAGLVVLIMSVTGVLLAYQRQLTSWADMRSLPPIKAEGPAGGQRLPAETLIAQFRDSNADLSPIAITTSSVASAPASISANGNRTLFLNPYTGAVLGEGSKGIRSFFRAVTDWHRWLGANGENRNAARAVTGASNLIFLFIVVSGFYLWWPRKWTLNQLRNVTWFKRGVTGRARDFNWHNVIGLWSAVPLFLVVLSGVVISYPWASNLVYRVVGENPPTARPAPPQQAQGQGGGPRQTTPVALEGLNRAWQSAEQQVPGWRTISLRLPTTDQAPLAFTIDSGDGGQPQRRGTLTINRTTGETMKWEPFSSLSTGRRLRSVLRFAHTGEVLGIAGQTVAGLVSLGAVFLVYTGLALAVRRLRAWIGRRQALSLKGRELTVSHEVVAD